MLWIRYWPTPGVLTIRPKFLLENLLTLKVCRKRPVLSLDASGGAPKRNLILRVTNLESAEYLFVRRRARPYVTAWAPIGWALLTLKVAASATVGITLALLALLAGGPADRRCAAHRDCALGVAAAIKLQVRALRAPYALDLSAPTAPVAVPV